MIYTFRNENSISGERYTTEFLYNYLIQNHQVIEQEEYDLKKVQSFWTFLSISKYSNLINISKNNLVDLLIIKIPTASQIFLIPLLTRRFKGKIVIWVDGLMWEFSGVKISLELIKREPLVFFARMLINNNIWSRLAYFLPLTYVVSSETQKLQFFGYLHPKSKIHVIPNAVPYALDFINSTELEGQVKSGKKVKFGYIGHSYPVKGLSDIKKSFDFLYKKGISPELELALSERGGLPKNIQMSLPNVEYTGIVNRSEFYSRIDCLIFPYWADWGTNTFPSVLLESIELGIPVIISDSELSRELFKENSALFYERKNYLNLAHIIENIYLDYISLPSNITLKDLYRKNFSKESIRKKWGLVIGITRP